VDATGSGSCPVAGFGINGVEPSDSLTRKLKPNSMALVRDSAVGIATGYGLDD
jgi:hypothetical protein